MVNDIDHIRTRTRRAAGHIIVSLRETLRAALSLATCFEACLSGSCAFLRLVDLGGPDKEMNTRLMTRATKVAGEEVPG
jgi:hypothetical protein